MGFFNHLFNLDRFDAISSKHLNTTDSTSGLGLDEKTVELVLAEIDVDSAIYSHENWNQLFEDALDANRIDNLSFELVGLDYRCDLGKWLYGAGGERFAKYPAFKALLSRHRYFHLQAAKVLAQAQSGDVQKARETLHGSYRHASNQVVLLLKELKRGLGH
jgi:Chemoreceptor zinc-binding domain